MTVRVRFAPSPTGHLHLGSAMVALANRAFADARAGSLVLRIDDTDRERSTPDAVEGILSVLGWLGIAWDEGPSFQRTRDDVYAGYLERLLNERVAYRCFCSAERLNELRQRQLAAGEPPRYDGMCRELAPAEVSRRTNLGESSVVRLRVPEDEAYDFVDLVRGSVAAPAGSFGDPVLRRSDNTFGYLFASACDDLELGITHVLRGEDHLPNTPRQLAILDALDAPAPEFAHLPLLHAPGGAKLAKRDHLGSLDELRRAGWRPLTVRRYLAELLGQGAIDLAAPGGARFDLARVPPSSPTVDEARLASIGREDIAAMSPDDMATELAAIGLELREPERALASVFADGAANLGEVRDVVGRLRERPAPPDEPFTEREIEVLEEFFARARDVAGSGDWLASSQELIGGIRAWGSERALRPAEVMVPVRRALTGVAHGPALAAIVGALGPDEVLQRVRRPLGGMTSKVSG